MFLTQYDKGIRHPVPAGSRYKTEYQLETEPDGNTHLVEVGTKDIYQEIQSFKDSCTLENIVRRALNGDPTALQQRQGVFGDARFDANDLIAANNAVKQAQNVYRSLSAEKRAEYGSFDEFVKSFGTIEGINKLFAPHKAAPEEASVALKEVMSDAVQTA